MLQDFKKFILRGNVVDLAVAVVIGTAFGAIVTSLVKDFITPLIGAIYKQNEFAAAYFTINDSKFMYGDFINALLNFLIIAAVVFFLVIVPLNKLTTFTKRNETTPEPSTKKCPHCLSEIAIAATRCAFCTSPLTQKNTAGKTNASSK